MKLRDSTQKKTIVSMAPAPIKKKPHKRTGKKTMPAPISKEPMKRDVKINNPAAISKKPRVRTGKNTMPAKGEKGITKTQPKKKVLSEFSDYQIFMKLIELEKEDRQKTAWTPEQDAALRKAIEELMEAGGSIPWERVAACIPEKKKDQCKSRYIIIEKEFRKQRWTKKDTEALEAIIEKQGAHDWQAIAKKLGGDRNALQVRNRWTVIDKQRKRQSWDMEEDERLLFGLHIFSRQKPAKIRNHLLPERSVDDVKARIRMFVRVWILGHRAYLSPQNRFYVQVEVPQYMCKTGWWPHPTEKQDAGSSKSLADGEVVMKEKNNSRQQNGQIVTSKGRTVTAKKAVKISEADQLKVNTFLTKLGQLYRVDRANGNQIESDGQILTAADVDPDRSQRLNDLLNAFKPSISGLEKTAPTTKKKIREGKKLRADWPKSTHKMRREKRESEDMEPYKSAEQPVADKPSSKDVDPEGDDELL